ncbi:MAG: Smr/MutS family protein [Chiayiivirga sp.]|jgi:DNA-nicking Smr family endonuclease|uniref:Smr/MutS family protein n=1 Tax=Chiayiivirga sp. TaxID=2041042 RepID=UPI0025C246E4|nr:Smr/MutS family protein [Chiayiivirga sp.]MCI1709515.1 Smr/MutS family protein [Chiayiivirga sp.]MCI1730193.1 Smr/MutS family protein [Chiayiivirga sp.]
MPKPRLPRASPPSDSDIELFHEAIGPVRRFDPAPEPPSTSRPPPRPRQREADEAAALRQSQVAPFDLPELALGDALEYLKPGLPPRLLQRLKRGTYSVQDEIDLHRMTTAEAELAVRRFLLECRDADRLCLRIVHGKGLRSGPEGPVLKQSVDLWLRQRNDVLAFASAPPAQGGTGAVLVLLASRRR